MVGYYSAMSRDVLHIEELKEVIWPHAAWLSEVSNKPHLINFLAPNKWIKFLFLINTWFGTSSLEYSLFIIIARLEKVFLVKVGLFIFIVLDTKRTWYILSQLTKSFLVVWSMFSTHLSQLEQAFLCINYKSPVMDMLHFLGKKKICNGEIRFSYINMWNSLAESTKIWYLKKISLIKMVWPLK